MTAALAVVEPAGPAPLVALARTARRRCLSALEHTRRPAPRATAVRVLSAAAAGAATEEAGSRSPSGLARSAHQALTRLREAAFRHDTGRADRSAYDSARHRAAEALDACGVFTAEQRHALPGDPSWEAALRRGSEHAEALREFDAARAAFGSAARELLDPGSGHGRRHAAGEGRPRPRRLPHRPARRCRAGPCGAVRGRRPACRTAPHCPRALTARARRS